MGEGKTAVDIYTATNDGLSGRTNRLENARVPIIVAHTQVTNSGRAEVLVLIAVATSQDDGLAWEGGGMSGRKACSRCGIEIAPGFRLCAGGLRAAIVVRSHGIKVVTARCRATFSIVIRFYSIGLNQRTVTVKLDVGDTSIGIARYGVNGDGFTWQEISCATEATGVATDRHIGWLIGPCVGQDVEPGVDRDGDCVRLAVGTGPRG